MNEQAPQTEKKNQSNSKQYLSIALILILLGMGIAMIYKSCAPAKKVVAENLENTTTDILDEDAHHPEDQTLNDIINKQDVDFIDDEEEDFSTIGTDDSQINAIEESTTKQKTRPTENIRTTVLTDAPNIPSRVTKYMVITGSFSSIENARKRLEQTIAAGCRNAEIVQFDHSKYHTVCALRTNQETTARATIQKLTNKKIDAFLHKQK